MEEKHDNFGGMTVDETPIDKPGGETPDERELLIFGESGGSFTNDGDKNYRRLRARTVILLLLAGLMIGAAAAYFGLSAYAGGARGISLARTFGKHDVTVIGDLLDHIDKYHFGDPLDDKKLVDSAAHALVDAMEDPYAAYFTPKEHDDYSQSFNGNYVGIGIIVYNPDGTGALVHRVYEDSFAEQAGMKAGDLIVAVDGVDVKNVSSTELVERVTGEPGTTVDITFLRDGAEQTVTVTRGEVYVKRVEYAMLENNVGYLSLTTFSGNAVNEFRGAIDALKEQGAEKLVVDLRDNPGGSLGIVVDICDMLLPEGVICSMQGKTTDPTKYFESDAEMYDIPFVVLVNDYSASASEIFAGAMQDNGRAKIIGIQTYGKGVVQTTFPMGGDHGWIKLTTDAYYTPNGTNLGGTGITPDRIVELPEELRDLDIYDLFHEHRAEDTQLKAALEELEAAN